MPKRKARQWRMVTIKPATAIVTCIVLGFVLIVGIPAQKGIFHSAIRMNALLTPAPLSPTSPSKEYIYAGGRLLATEEATSTSQVNLAYNKPAAQSSTFTDPGSGVSFSASRAVDGITNGDFNRGGSTSATNYQSQPAWQVDLGGIKTIDSIQLWSRTDCCPEMLRNFYVFVSDVPFSSAINDPNLTATKDQPGVSSFYTPGDGGRPTTLGINRSGRYVRVQLSGSQNLTLAEVQVWGISGLDPIPTETVVWIHPAGVSVSSNNLTKTAVTPAFDAGAVSSRAISSGDGYVEFTVGEKDNHKMCGLSNGDTNQDFPDIDFALYPNYTGDLYVYEGGVQIGKYGTYVPGDKLRVAVEGEAVKYQKWSNGSWTTIYTSQKKPSYPLLVDTSLYSTGATIKSAVLGGTLQDAFPPSLQTEGVVWTNAVGVSASGNNLTRLGNPDAWNAGAVSTQAIASGNGYVEFTIGEMGNYKMCGLSNGDTDQNYPDIDFAIFVHANSYLQIYESGVLQSDTGRIYKVGDRLKVSIEDGMVKYWHNDQLLWTSTSRGKLKYPLLVDTSLYSSGATIKKVMISGVLQ